MEDELTRLKKSYLQVLLDFDEALSEIEKIARRFRKKQQTEVFSKKKYPQKKKQGAVRLTVS